MGEVLDVARVDPVTGEVVNVERATAEWVAEQPGDGTWLYVVVVEATGPAVIGGRWDAGMGRFTAPVHEGSGDD